MLDQIDPEKWYSLGKVAALLGCSRDAPAPGPPPAPSRKAFDAEVRKYRKLASLM